MTKRLLVALDPQVGVSPAALARVWQRDSSALAVGGASVTTDATGLPLLPGVSELVTVPMAVNMAPAVVSDLLGRLVNRCRSPQDATRGLELTEVTTDEGDRAVMVRVRVS